MSGMRKSSHTKREQFEDKHRLEHWYVNNQVYFITARCRDQVHAFAGEQAKAVFWDRFAHYTQKHTFTPWVVSLLDNHYHLLGHLKSGDALGPMMRKLHGSTAKLVNDQLAHRLTPFWRERGKRTYFDGCIRDEHQCRKAYRYTLTQGVRHGVCTNWRDYPHTRVYLDIDRCVRFAHEHHAFMEGVPYKRYGH